MAKSQFFKSWRMTNILEGALVVLVGCFGIFTPNLLLSLFSLVVGIGVLVYGVVKIIDALRIRKATGLLPKAAMLGGILAAVAGLVFLINQTTPVKIIALVFGIWSLASGAFLLNRAVTARQAGLPNKWLFVQGIIKLAFGLFLVVNPWSGTAFWLQIIGGYLVYLGVAFIISVFTATEEPL